jgi:hypothetical protein
MSATSPSGFRSRVPDERLRHFHPPIILKRKRQPLSAAFHFPSLQVKYWAL